MENHSARSAAEQQAAQKGGKRGKKGKKGRRGDESSGEEDGVGYEGATVIEVRVAHANSQRSHGVPLQR